MPDGSHRSPDVECLCGEATAFQQGDKSSVAAYWVPFGIDGQENEVNVAHVAGSLQPLQGMVPVTEPKMNLRHRIWWNIAVARDRFQGIQHLQSFIGPA